MNIPADAGSDMEEDGRRHPHKSQDNSKNKDARVADTSMGKESNLKKTEDNNERGHRETEQKEDKTRVSTEELNEGKGLKKENILENSEKKEPLVEVLDNGKKVEKKQKEETTEHVSSSLEAKMREAESVGQELARTALEAREGLHKSITDLRQETKDLERETLTRIRQEVGRYFGG